MAGGWGCPHEINDRCSKVNNLPCSPGMKGCELAGRFRFANEDKNTRFREKQAREAAAPTGQTGAPRGKQKPEDSA